MKAQLTKESARRRYGPLSAKADAAAGKWMAEPLNERKERAWRAAEARRKAFYETHKHLL